MTGGKATQWERKLEEEGSAVTATLTLTTLALSISPSVSAYADHANKRHAAGVYFEMAAKYAERVQGTITQHATVSECKEVSGSVDRILAVYPLKRLDFSQVCRGFQELFVSPLE